MNLFLNVLLAIAISIDHAHSMSLLDRHVTKLQDPRDPSTHLNALKHVIHPNFGVGPDVIAGPKSVSHVGTFRGKPIVSRQKHTFVDDNGDGISLLPYNYDSWRIHTRPNFP